MLERAACRDATAVGRQQARAAVDGAGAAEVVVIYKSPARFPYGNWEEGMRGDGGRSGRDVASWAKVRLFLRE